MKLMEIYNHLFEVRIIDPKTWNEKEPIKDTDVIRVYHGFSGNSYKYPSIIAKFGLSGKERAKRLYSYEAVNNPKGLFITIDFKQAEKQFAGSGVIMEFHTKVSDLEAPVWNSEGGGYFVQGQFTKGFDNDDEREERRLKNRAEFRQHENPAVSQSDRPELAFWLLDGAERQALFIGDLNPNMIRAFWVNEKLIKDRKWGGKWERMNRAEFMKRYPIKSYKKKDPFSGKEYDTYSDEYYDADNKLFKPADDFSEELLFKRFRASGWEDDEAIPYLLSLRDYELTKELYPKQIKQFREKYGNKSR